MLNEVRLLGRVADEPASRSFSNGDSVCNFRLATTEKWKDKNTGEAKEKSEFHSIAVFGTTAKFVAEYVIKGDLLHVSGKLSTRSWEAKDGTKRYVTEVVVQGFSGSVNKLNFSDKKQKPAPTQELDDEIPF
jgi:single-strand DNA-binding protein